MNKYLFLAVFITAFSSIEAKAFIKDIDLTGIQFKCSDNITVLEFEPLHREGRRIGNMYSLNLVSKMKVGTIGFVNFWSQDIKEVKGGISSPRQFSELDESASTRMIFPNFSGDLDIKMNGNDRLDIKMTSHHINYPFLNLKCTGQY